VYTRWILAVIVGGLLCFFLAGAVFCQATLHVPRRLGQTPPDAITVSIVAADRVNLSAWWTRPAKSNGNCVVVLHGIGDSRIGGFGFAPMFRHEGYSVLVPDSRGHGASGGQFVTYGLLERYDVIAWADWMRRAGCRKVYGLGESLGASILIEAAAVQPAFSAIVAECPYADLRETAEYRARQMIGKPAWLVVSSAMLYARWIDGLDLQHVSPLVAIAHTSTPILLIHGLKDVQTPPYNSERLAKANSQDPLWLVPDAVHTGAAAAEPEEFRTRVLKWFAEH
jgi:dipeptidyl aminopeptidase/acylaminoacyl peptidase